MKVSELKLQQLSYFIDVCKTESFTKAAQMNYTSQSNISYAIRELEKGLDVTLFDRKDNNVVLTEAGKALLPYVQNAFKELQEGCHAIQEISGKVSGEVCLCYSYSYSLNLMPGLLEYLDREFEKRGADIIIKSKINNVDDSANITEDYLLKGQCELCVTCVRMRDKLENELITQQETCVLLPRNHPLTKSKKLTLEDIKDEPIVLLNSDNAHNTYYRNLFEYSGITPSYLVYEGLSWPEILVYVSARKCVTLAPTADYAVSGITAVELDHPLKMRDMYLCWMKNKKLSPAAKLTKELIIRYFKG